MSISDEQRITNRPGYDSRPTFYKEDFLLYTVEIDGQTDIMLKDIYEGGQMNLTKSPESEYSAQVIGNYDTFGAMLVGKDGKQRLWLDLSYQRSSAPWANRVRCWTSRLFCIE